MRESIARILQRRLGSRFRGNDRSHMFFQGYIKIGIIKKYQDPGFTNIAVMMDNNRIQIVRSALTDALPQFLVLAKGTCHIARGTKYVARSRAYYIQRNI